MVFLTRKKEKEVIAVCPMFKKDICEVAGIEPVKIACADEMRCRAGEWEKCKVYISHYFISTGMASHRIRWKAG